MVSRKGLVCAAACAAMTITGVARAEEASIASPALPATHSAQPTQAALPTVLTLTPPRPAAARPVYLDDLAPTGPGATTVIPADQPALTATPAAAPADQPAPAARTPLMSLFDAVGVGKTLDDLHIAIYGRAEGSDTFYAYHHPVADTLDARLFDEDYRRPELNQVAGVVERTVDAAIKAHTFDVGARFEILYGSDARFIHSLGTWDTQRTHEQWDVLQLYGDIAIPVGNGLRIRAGKFNTFAGQEVIDPTANLFFSHSFLFDFAIPFTQTGAYVTYALNDKLTLDVGATRGWDVSLKSYNDNWDGIGRLTYAVNDNTSAIVDVVVGRDEPVRNSKWRELVDFILTTNVNDHVALAFNADYAHEDHSAALGGATSAQWFGGAGYLSIALDRPTAKTPMFALNLRAEYFNDDKGVRVPGAIGTGIGLFEGTIGLAITPFPDNAVLSGLVIRPEFRVDYANKHFFDAGANRYQYTAAVDAYYKF